MMLLVSSYALDHVAQLGLGREIVVVDRKLRSGDIVNLSTLDQLQIVMESVVPIDISLATTRLP